MVYDWKRNLPVNAQAAGEYLEQLEKAHGEITSKLVLDASRSEDALLHPCFEWDDGVAAEKYRETQAGYLIRNLVVKVERDEATPQAAPQSVRAYVNVSAGETGSFIAVATAMSVEETRARVLDNALRELQAFRQKYKDLSELADVFSAISALCESV
jgi:hypothetical protein